ncbi:MAG: hypothetical protein H8E66_22465 [Planctomycetes bacterium]|nr:hypothetical protein [Planctomycetota bacterium]
MRRISQSLLRSCTLGAIGLVMLAVGGCSSNSVPAPDLNGSFAKLTVQVEQMSATLEAVPDKFELDTRKKVDEANQLLEDTAKQLAEQALTFHEAWESLRAHRNMTGEFDTSHVDSYAQAMQQFETQWQRLLQNNQRASDRLYPLKQMVDDATAA